MAVSTTDTFSGPYAANGVTVAFPFTFKAASAAELRVFILDGDGVEQTVAGDMYTVTLATVGGTVLFGTAPTGGDLYIESEPLFLQEIAFSSGQPYRPETVNEANDRAAIRDLVLKNRIARAAIVPLAGWIEGQIPVVRSDGIFGLAGPSEPGIAETAITFVAEQDQTIFNLGFAATLPLRVVRAGSELSDDAYNVVGTNLVLLDPCNEDDPVKVSFAERTYVPSVSAKDVLGLANPVASVPAPLTLRDFAAMFAHIKMWKDIDLTGTVDCTVAFRRAVNEATAAGLPLEIPAGKIRLTETITLPNGCVLRGMSGAYVAATRLAVTTLYFDHDDVGLYVTDPGGPQAVHNIGFLRNQAVPGPDWEPSEADYDIYVEGDGDFVATDILHICSSRGIRFANGGGRHTLNNIRGQVFRMGIDLEYSLDVTRIFHTHFWDFWSSNFYVRRWTLLNGIAIRSARNDNCDMHSIFSIFYRYGFEIDQLEGVGTTRRLRVFGYGADACGTAIYVAPGAIGCTAEFHGMYGHGYDDTDGDGEFLALTTGSMIDVNGENGDLRFYGKTDLSSVHRNAVRLVGEGHAVTINDLSVKGFNLSEGGHAAIWVDPAAYGLTLRGEKAIDGSLGSTVYGTVMFAGGGKVRGMWRSDFAPVITDGGGAIGASTIQRCEFRIDDDVCAMRGKFTPGSGGSGDLRITLPYDCTADGDIPGVIKVTTGAKMGTIEAFASDDQAVMNLYDGSYPGDLGSVKFNLEYKI